MTNFGVCGKIEVIRIRSVIKRVKYVSELLCDLTIVMITLIIR